MRTIYKYILEEHDTNVIQMPELATILKVERQQDQICMWAEVDTTRPLTPYTFRIFGTGNSHPEDEMMTYLNTVIMGYFVWHVYLKHN